MLTQVGQSLKISLDMQRKEQEFLIFTSINIVFFFLKLDFIETISVIISSCSYCCSQHNVEIRIRNTSIICTEQENQLLKRTNYHNLSYIFHQFSIYFQCQFKNLAIIFKALLSRMHLRVILSSLHNETAVSLQATLTSVKLSRLEIKCSQLMAVI